MEVMVLGLNKKDKDGVIVTKSGKHMSRETLRKNTESFLYTKDINTSYLLLSYNVVYLLNDTSFGWKKFMYEEDEYSNSQQSE